MLSRLHLQNFTVFADADFHFSPGLNVIVGTNGTGKSHVLKMGYAVEVARASVIRQQNSSRTLDEFGATVAWVANLFNLRSVFQAWESGNLIGRNTGNTKAEIKVRFSAPEDVTLKFEILPKDEANGRTSSVRVNEGKVPQLLEAKANEPVFIPAKEILTMMPDIIGLSEQYPDLLDATYTSLARKLTIRLLAEPPVEAQLVILMLSNAMQGTIKAENGRFYLQPVEGETFEIGLVAEGYRKLATLAYLLSNGSLTPRATLFWDEPEANLNPALLRQLAEVLASLARAGFQIILATHSLFLLKQFHILSRAKDQPALPIRYFGLNAKPGGPTEVTAVDDFELLPDVVALDEELAQADELTILFAQDDAHTDGR